MYILFILIALSIPFSYFSFRLFLSYKKRKYHPETEKNIHQIQVSNLDIKPHKQLIGKCKNCGMLVISTVNKCPYCGEFII